MLKSGLQVLLRRSARHLHLRLHLQRQRQRQLLFQLLGRQQLLFQPLGQRQPRTTHHLARLVLAQNLGVFLVGHLLHIIIGIGIIIGTKLAFIGLG